MNFNKLIKEDFYDAENYKSRYSSGNKYVEIYKNPTAEEYRRLLKESQVIIARGVLLRDGSLYVISAKNVIHEDLLKILDRRNVLDFAYEWDSEPKYLNKFLCVVGFKNKKLAPADSYQQEPFNEIKEGYLDIYKKLLKNNNSIFKLELE